MEKQIAILGAGQLAKYLARAAGQLKIPVTIVAQNALEPACQEPHCSVVIEKKWTPEFLLKVFQGHEIVTFENEWISDSLLTLVEKENLISRMRPFFPSMKQVRTKWAQKQFFKKQGYPTAQAIGGETVLCNSLEDFQSSFQMDWPTGVVVKESELAYDGKGVFVFETHKNLKSLKSLFEKVLELKQKKRPFYLEEKIPFSQELALVFSRRSRVGSSHSEFISYPLVEFTSRNGICDSVFLNGNPNPPQAALEKQAVTIARDLSEKLDWCGTAAIEFFYCPSKGLCINEFAPRVHNSGHFSLTACQVSQFENHMRAISDMPLVPPESAPFAMMKNLIGTEQATRAIPPSIVETELDPGIEVYWYGKKEIRKGRKMGHINARGDISDRQRLIELVNHLAMQWEKETL